MKPTQLPFFRLAAATALLAANVAVARARLDEPPPTSDNAIVTPKGELGTVVGMDAGFDLPGIGQLAPASADWPDPSAPFVIKSVTPTLARVGGVVTYTLQVANPTSASVSLALTDVLPAGLSFISGSLTGGASFDAGQNAIFYQAAVPSSLVYEWQPTTSVGWYDIAPFAFNLCTLPTFQTCDDNIVNFTVTLGLNYYGVSDSHFWASTNGLFGQGVGGLNILTYTLFPRAFPNPTPPNGVIAPFWTDLDMDGASGNDSGVGQWYYTTTLSHPNFSGQPVMIFQWNGAAQYGTTSPTYTLQFLALPGTDRYFVVYSNTGTLSNLPTRDLSIGAENQNGSLGADYFHVFGSDEFGAFPSATPASPLALALVRPSAPPPITFRAHVTAPPRSVVTNTAEYVVGGQAYSASVALMTGGALYLPITSR